MRADYGSQDRERVNIGRDEFPSSTAFLLGTTEALQNPWLAIIRYMTLFLAVIPVSLPFVLDSAYCIQAWLIQGDAAMTVGAPQQPLGSSFGFGFGLAHAQSRARMQARRTEVGLNATQTSTNNLASPAESWGPGASGDCSRRKTTMSRETRSPTIGNETEHKNTDPFTGETQNSPNMRSFAEAKGDSTWPAVSTPSIIPDLGQVDFVFIDKTGTLTGNDMTFSMCSVVGRCAFSLVPAFGCAAWLCASGL